MDVLPSYAAKAAALQTGTSCYVLVAVVPPNFESRIYEGQAIKHHNLCRPDLLKLWNGLPLLPKDGKQAAALGMMQTDDADVAEVDTAFGEHSTEEEDSTSEASLEAPPEPENIPFPRIGLTGEGFQVPSKAPIRCTFRVPPGLEPPPGLTQRPMFGFQEFGCSSALMTPIGEWNQCLGEMRTITVRPTVESLLHEEKMKEATTSGCRRVQGKAPLARSVEPTRTSIDARKIMNKKMCRPDTEAELREQSTKAAAEMGLESLRARGQATLAAMHKLSRAA